MHADVKTVNRVRNWSTFQHYKKRSPPWIKMHKSLLDDQEYHALDPIAAKYLTLVWLLASETDDGSLPPDSVMAFRMRISVDQFREIIELLAPWIERASNMLATESARDSNTLAPCKRDDTLETERETEGEGDARAGGSVYDLPEEPTIAQSVKAIQDSHMSAKNINNMTVENILKGLDATTRRRVAVDFAETWAGAPTISAPGAALRKSAQKMASAQQAAPYRPPKGIH